jgi:signal transduction histidine kinase
VVIGARADGPWVEIEVSDNGCGMTPETLQHVFEPLFTARRGTAVPGTGLGLSISHLIVEEHGGTIRAESAGLGKGSRFVVRLPAATQLQELAV